MTVDHWATTVIIWASRRRSPVCSASKRLEANNIALRCGTGLFPEHECEKNFSAFYFNPTFI